MNGMMRKICSIILVSVLMILFGCNALAENPFMTYSGQCGDNLYWEVSADGKTLTISGSGGMYDYGISTMPWNDHADKIEQVVFTGNITKIGSHAFYSHGALTSITIPDSVTSIGSYAFDGCSKLQEVKLPENLKEIKESAFSSCIKLKSIEIPEGITKIESWVFNDCYGLTEVSLPASVTEVAQSAFNGCSKLADVYYAGAAAQSNLIAIGDDNTALKDAVWHCSDGNYLHGRAMSGQCGDNLYWEVSADGKTLTISGSGGMYDYNSSSNQIPWNDHADKIEQVVFTGNITKIGSHAFYSHGALTSITIPDSVTSIGSYAFDGCLNLPEVKLSENLKEIKSFAFSSCTKLKNIEIPEGITKIESRVFSFCYGLTEVSLPASVTEVAQSAFNGCSKLADVYYVGSMEQAAAIVIGYDNVNLKDAVWHCTDGNCTYSKVMSGQCGDNLYWEVSADRKTLTISGSGGMYDYGTSTMPWNDHEDKIEQVVFTGNITKIGNYAFHSHEALTSITIPDSVTSIGAYAFSGCTNLQEVKLPENLKEIKSSAFLSCGKIKSIEIPEGITKIESWVFNDCYGLTEVSLPASVTEVERGAFSGCSELADVYYAGSEEESYAIKIGYDNADLKEAVWHYDAGKTDEPEPPVDEDIVNAADMPQTGDSSSIALWSALLSMAVTAMLMIRKRAYN